MASSTTKAAAFRGIAFARRSCKRFETGRLIPTEVMRDILQSTIRSPSSFNLQPTHIIMVQSQEVKNRLAEQAMLGIGNQHRVRDASALAVFIADLQVTNQRLNRIYELEEAHQMRDPNYMAYFPTAASFRLGEGHAATFVKQVATDLLSPLQPMPCIDPIQAWSNKNTALMAQSFVLAATSHDLATCIMEGFDGRRVQQVLRIPDRYEVPLMVATGYDYNVNKEEKATPRLDLDEVVFSDTFGNPIQLNPDEAEEAEESQPAPATATAA